MAPSANNCLGQMGCFTPLLWWESSREFLNRLGSPVTDAFFMEPGDLFRWWCDVQVTVNIRVCNMNPFCWALWQAPVLPPCVVLLDCAAHQGNQAFHDLCLWEWTKRLKGWLKKLVLVSMKHTWFSPYKKALWGQLTCNGKVSKYPCWIVLLTWKIFSWFVVIEGINGVELIWWTIPSQSWWNTLFEGFCIVGFCNGLSKYELIFI